MPKVKITSIRKVGAGVIMAAALAIEKGLSQ